MLDAKHKSSDKGGMNKLRHQTRVQILSMLCEGSSMRSISRIYGRLHQHGYEAAGGRGQACAAYHDEPVRGVKARAGPVRRNLVVLLRKEKNVAGREGRPGRRWRRVDVDRAR